MKLLLHICCGPCAVYPVSVLQEEGIDFEGFFFNPNIHPRDEFERRMENVKKLSEIKGFNVTYFDDFRQGEWESFSGPEEQRCRMCYAVRMDKAAAFAKENGFDAFTTTLLISPYQKHDLLAQPGKEAANRHGIEFYYRDFRPQFREGQRMAKEMGLYRQKFCGCIISFNQTVQKNHK